MFVSINIKTIKYTHFKIISCKPLAMLHKNKNNNFKKGNNTFLTVKSDITSQDAETQRPPSIQRFVGHTQAQAVKTDTYKHRHSQEASERSILKFLKIKSK